MAGQFKDKWASVMPFAGPRGEPSHRQTNLQPILEFTDRVKEKKKKYAGRNGLGEVVLFMPLCELQEYWRNPKIDEVCKSYEPHLPTRFEAVRKLYLRIFSLLVYLDKVQYLPSFLRYNITDDQLPFTEIPQKLEGPTYETLFEGIQKHQWLFCPLIFDYARLSDLVLDPQHVLPFYDEVLVKQSDSTDVIKFRVHEACNEPDKNRPGDDAYVLKRYTHERQRGIWLNESKALTYLHERKVENIVGYYGSFIQNGTFNLILQYADGGNLLELWDKKQPPQSPDQIRQFWRSLFKVLKGLYCLHQLILNQNSGEYKGIHQDIKPDNILLTGGKPDSEYDFVPMLADFGHSHIRVARKEGTDELGIDRHGNQTYGAPESSHHARYRNTVPNHITSEADIFSIGCVMSDAAAWVALGTEGRMDYVDLRIRETQTVPNFEDPGGHQDCFHNGVGRLRAVDEMHARIRQACARGDGDLMTPRVVAFVEDHMLLEKPSDRLPASRLYEKFQQVLQDFEQRMELPSSPSSPLPGGGNSTFLQESFGKARSAASSLAARFQRTVSSEGAALGSLDDESSDAEEAVDDSRPASPPPPPPPPRSPRMPPRPGPTPLQESPDLRWHSEGPTTHTTEEVQPGGVAERQRHPYSVPFLEPRLYRLSRPRGSSLSRSLADLGEDGEDALHLTLDQAEEWRKTWKDYDQLERAHHRVVGALQGSLRGRDHLFFVDDSRHMAPHRERVVATFQTLAYIAKATATGGGKDSAGGKLELALASRLAAKRRVYGEAHSTPLVAVLQDKAAYAHDGCVMEDRLCWLVDDVIIPRLPDPDPSSPAGAGARGRSRSFNRSSAAKRSHIPLSVVVFTDGRWGRDAEGAAGVQNPIGRLIAKIQELGVGRTHVMMQFLRFGDDEDGMRHLRYLVDFAKKQGCDIVDTQPIDGGNVCSMLIGSINHEHDSDKDAESSQRA